VFIAFKHLAAGHPRTPMPLQINAIIFRFHNLSISSSHYVLNKPRFCKTD